VLVQDDLDLVVAPDDVRDILVGNEVEVDILPGLPHGLQHNFDVVLLTGTLTHVNAQVYVLIKPMLRHSWKLNPSTLGSTVKPTPSEMAFQCLSFMPSFLKATIRGRLGLNLSISTLTLSPTATICARFFSLKTLITAASDLIDYYTNFSAELASSRSKGWFSHLSISVYQRLTMCHRVL
jgi:hypothetical protein